MDFFIVLWYNYVTIDEGEGSMEQRAKVINVTTQGKPVDAMKIAISSLLEYWCNSILEETLPQREEYDTKEEYETAAKRYMLSLADDALKAKHDIFAGVLDSYNELLHTKYQIENQITDDNNKSKNIISQINKNIRRTGFFCIGAALILPSSIPFLILFNLPAISVNMFIKNTQKKKMMQNEKKIKDIDEVQDPFFELMDTIRTDYFASKDKIAKLKERALKGENIVEPILQMMSPETLSLPKAPPMEQLIEASELQPKEQPKEYKKIGN